jgi:protein SCO1/2
VVFGYTHCPDYCPSTLLRLSQALKELEADAAQVQVLFITVDPARDTPAMLGKYIPAFNPSFIGLSGEAAAVLRAARSFGVSFARVKGPSPETYTVDHTTGIFFLDRGGRLRNVDQEDIPPARIAAEMRRLIKAK